MPGTEPLQLLPDELVPPSHVLEQRRGWRSQLFPLGFNQLVVPSPNLPYEYSNIGESSPLWLLKEGLAARQSQLNRMDIGPGTDQTAGEKFRRNIRAVNHQLYLAQWIHVGYHALRHAGTDMNEALAAVDNHIERQDQSVYDKITREVDELFRANAEDDQQLRGLPLSELEERRQQLQLDERRRSVRTGERRERLQLLRFEWLSARLISQTQRRQVLIRANS